MPKFNDLFTYLGKPPKKEEEQVDQLNNELQQPPVQQEQNEDKGQVRSFLENYIKNLNNDSQAYLDDLKKTNQYYDSMRLNTPQLPENEEAAKRLAQNSLGIATMGTTQPIKTGSLIDLAKKGKDSLIAKDVSKMAKLGKRVVGETAEQVEKPIIYSKDTINKGDEMLKQIMESPKYSDVEKKKAIALLNDYVRKAKIRGIE